MQYNYWAELNGDILSRKARERKTGEVNASNWDKESNGSKGISTYSMENIFNAYSEYKQNCLNY